MQTSWARADRPRISLSVAVLGALAAAVAGCSGSGSGGAAPAAAGAEIHAQALPPTQAQAVTWSAPIPLTIVPASGATLPNGKVMLWAGDGRRSFGSTVTGHTYTTLFDPATNTAVESNVTQTNHDMFCPGTARLPDGRLLVNGGLDAADTSIYDPATNTWSSAAVMNTGRGYNTSTTLADGSVFTLGGSWSGTTLGVRNAEIYTPAGGWRLLSGLPEDPFRIHATFGSWQDDSHMTLLPTANGKVLLVGPTVNMAWLDPTGNGSWTPAGTRGDDNVAFAELVVMYEPGKILKAGGATWNAGAPASASSYLIDTTGGTAAVRKVANMAYPRVYGSAVLLPNGQTMMIGGQTYVQEFSDSNAVLAPELFDPATETYTVLPAMTVPRTYHSIALLLPDARILAAGGGVCNCAADHLDAQIMAPPYLFNADGTPATRPQILSAPQALTYGGTLAVTTDSAVTAFSLVHMGATTHTVDNDQRRVPLAIRSAAGNSYQLAVPTNPNILLPGKWMLFAMNAQGTPSVAAIVGILPSSVSVQNPGTQNLKVNQSLYLTLSASAATALTWSSPSLPAGLVLSPAGILSGAPTATGNTVITLNASDGTQTVSTDFLLSVTDDGTGTGLTAQYFNGIGLSPPALLTRVEAPYFDWGLGSPDPKVPADMFSARWSGSIEAVASGVTTLSTLANDGIRVWVDNVLVVDNWANHTGSNTVPLTWVAGKRYPITIEYYDYTTTATLHLAWQPPGTSAAVPVPASHLYPATLQPSTDLAVGAAATQSSTAAGGEAARAVDGNTDGVFADGSVSQTTGAAPQDWWQVDLGGQSRIDTIQLWNRSDCCATNLMNFAVFVSASDMTGRTIDQLRADPTVILRSVLQNTNAVPDIGIPVNATGRFVRVQMGAQKVLALAEVQVWGASGASYHTPTLAVIPDQSTPAGGTVSLAASGTDPDGNPLSYSATGLPTGLSIAPATGLITGTAGTAGVFAVTVTAANAGNFSASRSFTWTVVGSLPTVTSIPAPVAASGSSVTYAPVIANGAGATYSWTFGDGSAATAASSSAGVSHTFAAPGVYTVSLLIQTGDGRSSTQSFMQAVAASGATAQPRASSNVMLEPRSGAAARLWVVNQDNDSVSVFDTSSGARLAEIAVGSAPRSVALGQDGTIWVTNKTSATLSAISPASLSVSNTLILPRASQPFGILVSPTDGSLFVALEATGQVLKLTSVGTTQTGSVAIGNSPRHLAMTATASQLFVSRFITRPMPGEGTAAVSFTDASGNALGGEVVVVNPASMGILRTLVLANSTRTDTEVSGRGLPNYLGGVAISPDGKSAWVPSKQDDIQRGTLRDGNALTFQNTVRSISSRLDLTANAEDLAGRVDHDNAGVASAALYHPNGVYVFVALETNRQVAVLDAAGKRELFRFTVGQAPQGLALSADGQTLYVNNFMDRTVGVVDLKPLLNFGQNTGTVTAWSSIASDHLTAQVLRGKQLFYDASDPRLARDSYLSCASCHNDGGLDGRTWDFTSQGEGLRNTIALRGRGGMGEGFLHWSANFDEVQDFEGQIRTLAAGTGLMSDAQFNTGTRSQPLGDPKAGVSADLDALAAYVTSLNVFASSPFRASDGTLTGSALAGKGVFLKNSCAACHGGAGFTLSADGSQLQNIGTLNAAAGKRNGGPLTGIDIPTLRDVWATGPYLHDGSAATLANAINAHTGFTLSATDLGNVAEYVREIGGEEPTSPGIYCAAANATCTLPAGVTATVSYGAGNNFATKTGVTGSVACSNGVFGDPMPGSTKACYYLVTAKSTVGSGTGLLGNYFATQDLSGAVVLTRTEAVYYVWSSGSPGTGVPATYWSARWTGTIEAPVTGSYQLQTNSDNGIRVSLNGTQVINDWTSHAATLDASPAVSLTAGQRYPITIEFFQQGGGATAQLSWKKPGDTAFGAVPVDRLYTN